VVLDVSAHVEPLLRLADRARWCVALVDRSRASFHLGNEDGMPLDGTLDDQVHGQHRQGGWSYGRYERSIENEVAVHLDHVADALRPGAARGPLRPPRARGPEDDPQGPRGQARQRRRERLAGWVDLDLSAADEEAVRTAAGPVIVNARREQERDVLARLAQGVGTPGGHGVAGLRTTLGALSERRVETLVVDPQLRSPRLPLPGLRTARAAPGGVPGRRDRDGAARQRHRGGGRAGLPAGCRGLAAGARPRARRGGGDRRGHPLLTRPARGS
jgi:hypothetical protein